ncbi:uncharacterized protein AC631_03414 [Debaryomyces fabryi]|uniref:6-phosphofructo-2-kinase domain-containing protein n=1 Tax=Debaryomyces fabryi TaxID=58627 RepID=A0A0V1PX48_9ASCO|nr:uncharacterized protein AC631_03414 [Debaryomyces fabryi]KSA00823.1 hypothetical protein AC631_03414 [Debaryomyces fabryi]CUM52028.1 unnamed protein product [Debaryomyces fabryi]
MSSPAGRMEDDSELFNGFGSAPLQRNPSSGKRNQRWSFHDNLRPNLVELPSEASAIGKRRMSDITGIDGVHTEIDPYHISPAQLYSTESGRLFHAGKICIALAGLPGRGKTHLSVSLTRYLRWLGVKTHLFHLGNYRRANAEDDLRHDLFVPTPDNPKAHGFRQKIVNECLNDMLNFFKNDKGQVAIYDAVNALPEYRLELHKKFTELNIQIIFVESSVTNDAIIMKNMEEAARSSPDYVNWDYEQAYKDYSERIKVLTPFYQEMGEEDDQNKLSYIKFINFGDRIELHNSNYGYLINKVVFFLMNSRIKLGSVFFARCYKNSLDYSYDPPLDETGIQYSKNLTETLTEYLKDQGKTYFDDKNKTIGSSISARPQVSRELSVDERHPAAGVDGVDDNSFVVWTSVKKRTIQSTQFFADKDINIRHRIQLSQKNPGIVGNMTKEEVAKKFPTEYEQFLKDPYHHRFSRAELYHDLAIKIEPLILEMERMSGDILIIADDTVLKVFYGYLMSCSCYDIPSLHFSTDEIIEIKFNAYSNSSKRIEIKDFS